MNNRRRSNSKKRNKNNNSSQPTLDVWSVYKVMQFITFIWTYMQMMRRRFSVASAAPQAPQIANHQHQQSKRRSRSRSKKKKNTTKTTSPVVTKKPTSATTKKTKEPESPPVKKSPKLLTFSVLPAHTPPKDLIDKLASKSKGTDKKKLVVESASEESYASSDGESGELKKPFKKYSYITNNQISKLTKQLIGMQVLDDHKSELRGFTSALAFLYRCHRLNLCVKSRTKAGISKEILYNLRTDFVHNIGACLFDKPLIEQTKAAVQKLDFSDLFESREGKSMNLILISDLLDLPILKQDNSSTQLNTNNITMIVNWIRDRALPLLNRLQDQLDNEKPAVQDEYYDAIRMMVIIIGEYCPKKAEHMQSQPGKPLSPFRQFVQDCRDLRNEFAHHASADRDEVELHDLLRLSRKAGKVEFVDESKLFDYVSPAQQIPKSFVCGFAK